MGRLKAYKRLFKNYALLGFREPYQVIVDDRFIEDTIKLDAQKLLEKALHGKVKMMVTSCCIRVLYEKNKNGVKDAQLAAAIERAKSYERKLCGHKMDEDPLTPRDCLMSVMNVKGKGNKNRYCLATQDEEIRREMREIPAIPLIYEKRSVIILEPMSESTQKLRQREEVAKYRDGIKSRGANLGKRKRENDDDSDAEQAADKADDSDGDENDGESGDRDAMADEGEAQRKKKKKHRGPKGPNPLAAKKPKKRPAAEDQERPKPKEQAIETDATGDAPHKKRKRKKKSATAEAEAAAQPVPSAGKVDAVPLATEGEA